jgi:hypothetical protein
MRIDRLRVLLAAALLVLPLAGVTGCRTIGTLFGATGEAVADTATAAGNAAGTAARGAGKIVEKTADAAADEIE